MKCSGWILAAILTLLGPMPTAQSEDDTLRSDAIVGLWETEHEPSGFSLVMIFEKDGAYHGQIVWLLDSLYPPDDPDGLAGRKRMDRNNPDPALRNRPIVGLTLMRSFVFDEEDLLWREGRIYDPENGKDYNCQLSLPHPDTLNVYGFVKVAFVKLGRSTVWTRVPDSLWSEN